jgi:Carbon storage regulator (could also regulate swarming and quorum sensing)
MLVITRRDGERIRIGSEIMLEVVRSTEGRVRIGIEAPPGIRILRDELEEIEDGDISEEEMKK